MGLHPYTCYAGSQLAPLNSQTSSPLISRPAPCNALYFLKCIPSISLSLSWVVFSSTGRAAWIHYQNPVGMEVADPICCWAGQGKAGGSWLLCIIGSAPMRKERDRRGNSPPEKEQVCGAGEGYIKTQISRAPAFPQPLLSILFVLPAISQ